MGVEAMVRSILPSSAHDKLKSDIKQVNNLQTKFSATYAAEEFANYTVAGHPAGLVKNAGTFSYLRVFGAGHEVPAYNFTGLAVGQAAAQFFEQAMRGEPLTST